jgi:hypothetical protein
MSVTDVRLRKLLGQEMSKPIGTRSWELLDIYQELLSLRRKSLKMDRILKSNAIPDPGEYGSYTINPRALQELVTVLYLR